MFQVIDSRTQTVVGTYSTLVRAYRRANKLDLEYGAVRYHVRRVPQGNAHVHPVMRAALAAFEPK